MPWRGILVVFFFVPFQLLRDEQNDVFFFFKFFALFDAFV